MEWTQQKRARQKELQTKLFGKRNEVVENGVGATPDEVFEYQHFLAWSHRTFFHYTNLQALIGMLETKRLRLSNLRNTNDLREAGDSKRVGRGHLYAASFSWPNKESIAMWWMYGLQGTIDAHKRVPVRLEFNGDAVRADLERARAIGKQLGWKVDFCDVLYRDYNKEPSEAKTWYLNGRSVLMAWHSRDSGRNAFQDASGCVKDLGWDYERETRIRVESPDSEGQRIDIPFDESLKRVKVLVGPGQSASDYLKIADRALAPWEIKAVSSGLQVRFSEWNQ